MQHDNKEVQTNVSGNEVFQSDVRRELRLSGIAACVTAQLRKQIYDALNESNKGWSQLHRPKSRQNLEQAAIRSLILEYLVCDDLQQSASVLAAESGFLESNYLSRIDSLKVYGIVPNSTIHSILTKNAGRGKLSDSHNSNSNYENTTIHILLFNAAASSMQISKSSVSTQTATSLDNYLEAREHLDRRLEMIHEKYKRDTKDESSKNDFEGAIEAKLLSIQKECEDRMEKEVDRQVKQFKDEIVVSMRKEEKERLQRELTALALELKREYDDKIQIFRKMESDSELKRNMKEREQEASLMKARETMRYEVDKLKQREMMIENKLELERKKLQIEEQRINHLLMTTETKLDIAEKKEKAFKDILTAEQERIRYEAKQKVDDALAEAKQRNDSYSKALLEISSLRIAAAHETEKCKHAELEIENLRTERKMLIKEIETNRREMEDVRSKVNEKDVKHGKEILQARKCYKDAESKLSTTEMELADLRRKEASKHSYWVSHCTTLENTVDHLQEQLRQSQTDIYNITLERSALEVEIDEMSKLFQKSQEALICKREVPNHMSRKSSSRVDHYGIYPGCITIPPKPKLSQPFRNCNHRGKETVASYKEDPTKIGETNLVGTIEPITPFTEINLSDLKSDKNDIQILQSTINQANISAIEREQSNHDNMNDSPSVHSVTTAITWDMSPMKRRFIMDEKKDLNQEVKIGVENVPIEDMKVRSLLVRSEIEQPKDDYIDQGKRSSVRSQKTENVGPQFNLFEENATREEAMMCEHEVPVGKEQHVTEECKSDYDQSAFKETEDTTHIYDMSDFEPDSNIDYETGQHTSDGEPSPMESSTTEKNNNDLAAQQYAEDKNNIPMLENKQSSELTTYSDESQSQSKHRIDESRNANNLSGANESYRSSSQSSAGIEVYKYNSSEKTDWW